MYHVLLSIQSILKCCLWVLVPDGQSVFRVHEQDIVWQVRWCYCLGVVDECVFP